MLLDMRDIGELLGEKEVVVALISAASGVLAIVLGKLFGLWTWVGAEISKWLEHRRQTANAARRVPRKTLHVIAGTGLIPPMMGKHDANGRISTDCRTPLLITNLTDSPVIPTKVRVKIRGIERFRRAAYQFSLNGLRRTKLSFGRMSPYPQWIV